MKTFEREALSWSTEQPWFDYADDQVVLLRRESLTYANGHSSPKAERRS
jgi:hypothetical protein